MNEYKNTGEFYKQLIERIVENRKITKATFAHEIGVTPTSLSRWIKGKSQPRKKLADKIIYYSLEIESLKEIKFIIDNSTP